jgi:D-3-phosphoglycerate dehydrogenase / 2-oxoglutarate reductase
MGRFKVALIDRSPEQVPAWVPEELSAAGIDYTLEPCTTVDDLVRVAGDANVLWIYGGSRLARGENLDLLPNCGAIIRSGSGVDVIDVDAATARGMLVCNTPLAHNGPVSDHTIALIFAVGRQIVPGDRITRAGDWTVRATALPEWHLEGQTLGLLGFGHIPRSLVRKLHGFNLNVLVFDPFVDAATLAEYGARSVTLDELLAESDIVSIHTPLTAQTHHLFSERELRLMKSSAILINTARGPIIDEAALYRALTEGWIAGAGLDVFEKEPSPADNPLFQLDNIVVTPHTAGVSDQSVEATWRLSVEMVIQMSNQRFPRSYVNRECSPRWALS